MAKRELIYSKDTKLEYNLKDIKLQKIIDFYLFNCPVSGKSVRGQSFKDFGWIGSSAFSKLKSKLLKSSTDSLKNNYFPCKKDELSTCYKNVATVTPTNEYCVFLKHDEKQVMQSLFSAIRNSFAHGSFNVKTYKKQRVYFFANFDGYLKAELILQEQTLLSWIDIITNGPNE